MKQNFTKHTLPSFFIKTGLLFILLYSSVLQAQYCTSNATNLTYEDIESVYIKGNTTTIDNFSGNKIPCGDAYTDFTTTIPALDLSAGGTYTIIIKSSTCSTFPYNHLVNVWIDYNRNNTFDNDEAVTATPQAYNALAAIFTYTFTVPCKINAGNSRMRIVMIESTTATPAACGTYTWGETEDYAVRLAPAASNAKAGFLVPSTLWVKTVSSFINTNTTGYISHKWDANNDGTIEAPNSVNFDYKWTTAGTKCLKLTSTNCAGTDSTTKCFTVQAPTAAPTANFVASKTAVEVLDVVKFFDLSTNGAYIWEWDVYDSVTYASQGIYPSLAGGEVTSDPFGNGSTESTKNPEFSFDRPGSYTVTLISRNDIGASPIFKKTLYINVTSSSIYSLGFGLYGPNGDNNVGTPSGSIYDNGGPDLDYDNNQGLGARSFLLITPCNATNIELTMTQLSFADAGDKLNVYDGNSASAPLLASWNSSSTAPAVVNAKSGSMYILFESNSSGVKEGFAGTYRSTLGPSTPTLPQFTHPKNFYNNTPATFVNTTQNIVGIPAWTWTINGVEPVGSSQKDFKYAFTSDGIYEVCLEIKSCIGNNKSCDSVKVVTPNTTTDIDFTSTSFRPVIKSEVVTLKAITDKANRFEWSISPNTYTLVNPPTSPSSYGAGFINYKSNPNNTIPSPQIVFNAPGCYTIFLRAYNSVDSVNTVNTMLKIDYICVLEYCNPNAFILSQDVGINRVVIRDGNNSLIDNNSTSGVAGYSDFSTTQKAALTYGKTYSLEIHRDNVRDPGNRRGWIDWNFDGDFTDSGESIFFEPSNYNNTYKTTFMVPPLSQSLEGATRLRVSISYDRDNNPVCGPVNVGEYEDYGIVLARDNSRPVITLKNNDTINIETGSTYIDPGATAFDASEGDISGSIVTTTDVDPFVTGFYTFVYNVKDKSGNEAAPVTRYIFVRNDLTAPKLTLNPGSTGCIQAKRTNAPYTEPGATATDNKAPFNLTSSIMLTGSVDTRKIGTYTLTYLVKDVAGNEAKATRIVCVEDTESPMIRNIGAANVQVNSNWADNSFAFDEYDSNPVFTKTWGSNGALNSSVIDDYTVQYKAVDQSGNDTIVSMTYHVDDYIPPTIQLNTLPVVYHEVGTVYVSVPVTVSDNYYSGANVTVSAGANNMNPNVLGTYQEVFTARDASGNKTQVTRIIIVVDTKAPRISGPTIRGCVGQDIWPMWNLSTTDNYYSPSQLKPLIQIVYQDVNPMEEGFYTITYRVTDPSGNTSADFTRNVVFTHWPNCTNSTVGVDNVKSLQEVVNIYPNPSKGIFNIELKGLIANNMNIEVYNALGQNILTRDFSNSSKTELDLTGHAAGIYTIKIISGNEIIVKHVTLQ
jgi:PKD repeat protein